MTFTSLLVLSLHTLARMTTHISIIMTILPTLARMTTQISKIKTKGMRKVTTETHQRRNC